MSVPLQLCLFLSNFYSVKFGFSVRAELGLIKKRSSSTVSGGVHKKMVGRAGPDQKRSTCMNTSEVEKYDGRAGPSQKRSTRARLQHRFPVRTAELGLVKNGAPAT